MRHQRATCSSDRKSSMVFQVKTIFSYQREAGTAKWMTPFAEGRQPLRTVSCIEESQQAHAVVITASRRSITGIASASQTQLAHQERLPDCTWKVVGTAQKGAARRISGDCG